MVERLLGHVKSVTIEEAEVSPEGVEGPRVLHTLETYRPDGRVQEMRWYKPDGTLDDRLVSSYDTQGRLTASASYGPDGGLRETRSYSYTPNSRECASYLADGALDARWVTMFDDAGHEIEVAAYNSNGSLGWKISYTNNEKGDLIETHSIHADGSESTSVLTYDEAIHTVEEVSTRKPWLRHWHRSVTRYDADGNDLVEARYGADGTLIERHVFANDKYGNRAEIAEYDTSNSLAHLTRYAYVYDSVGNWTRLTVYHWRPGDPSDEPRPVNVIYRTITYYDDTGPVGEALGGLPNPTSRS